MLKPNVIPRLALASEAPIADGGADEPPQVREAGGIEADEPGQVDDEAGGIEAEDPCQVDDDEVAGLPDDLVHVVEQELHPNCNEQGARISKVGPCWK